MNPKVSIIVPVFRAKEYLPNFIKILKRQTLQSWECIFVDDCGNDGSYEFLLQEAAMDSRIKCLQNETNLGPGATRNKGLSAAQGEYVTFADSDDSITDNFYELLYSKAKEGDYLVVKGVRALLYPNGKKEPSLLNQKIKNGLKTYKTLLPTFVHEHTTAIYQRAFVESVGARNAEDTRQGEDVCFLAMLLSKLPVERFAFEERVVYYYHQHENSLSHKKRDVNFLLDLERCYAFIVDYLLQLPGSVDISTYISFLTELRLGYRIDEAENASFEEICEYLDKIASRINRWKASDSPFRPGVYCSIFDELKYRSGEFYLLRNTIKDLRIQKNHVLKLQKFQNYALVMPEVKRKLTVLTIKKWLSTGKRRKNYSESINKLRSIVKEYDLLATQARNTIFK